MAAAAPGWWCLLPGAAAPTGPLDADAVAASAAAGALPATTALFWREGRPDWQPLAAVPELHVKLQLLQQAAAPQLQLLQQAAPQQQVEEVDALMFLTANGAPPDL